MTRDITKTANYLNWSLVHVPNFNSGRLGRCKGHFFGQKLKKHYKENRYYKFIACIQRSPCLGEVTTTWSMSSIVIGRAQTRGKQPWFESSEIFAGNSVAWRSGITKNFKEVKCYCVKFHLYLKKIWERLSLKKNTWNFDKIIDKSSEESIRGGQPIRSE